MKKNVLVFGLISGFTISLWTVISMYYCYTLHKFEGSMLVGYTAMVVALSIMFVGIKNYRDKFNGGVISFGKAFQIGILISLIASTIYVIAWLIDYYLFIPDFMDKFSAHSIEKLRASGKSAAEISKGIARLQLMKEQYKSPVWVVLYTYLEIFPVGLVVTLITALILKKKHPDNSLVTA